jgi:dihydroorotate dehydrogenase (NAD+) catalytic subunit
MHVEFAGIHLQNPVLAASGTFGYGVEFEDIISFKRIGGFVTKGISREPMAGNPPPRILETAAGMMNSIGLQNIGVKAFIETKLPDLRRYPKCRVMVNVFGSTVGDYLEVIHQLNDAEGIAAYELNASCPNTNHGGMAFGVDPMTLDELVWRSKQIAKRPLIVKLSPNVTSVAIMAKCAETAGADGISLINTFVALSIDIETRRSRVANVTGGLSGPAIKPIAVRMVWEAANSVKIPVMGLGGITNPEDAVEFLLAGATAVQVGTASYADPRAVERIAKGLESWCTRHHIDKIDDLIGRFDTSHHQ